VRARRSASGREEGDGRVKAQASPFSLTFAFFHLPFAFNPFALCLVETIRLDVRNFRRASRKLE
jgi:hypothetical protein